MIVTGAFLAEAASVAEGKLYVLGGVLTSWTRNRGEPVVPVIVVLTQASEDRQAHLTVTVHDPTGGSGEIALPVPAVTHDGTSGGFLFGQIGIPAEAPDGRYVLVVGDISLPLEVRTTGE
ncbi:hypothetical protein [Tsukamurella paurometabola]|uniref:Uncharacterized protein n=1 Tax=Tsukamurella paurometabola TaxID=2061 RepID=A0A3P8LCC5_TSUPA|nr:hypothetical protein [Tsukamurella paurometabola]UEA84399.1 hypothetical protein LK411_06135 [Tsukamurella paurometabola]VDR36962.1 Uncharacterised protein [Tsukamurella paurometabola]